MAYWNKDALLLDPPDGTILLAGQRAYDSTHRVTVEGPGVIGELTPLGFIWPYFHDASLTMRPRPVYPLRFHSAQSQTAGREMWLIGKWVFNKRAAKVGLSIYDSVAASSVITGVYKCLADGTCGTRISRNVLSTDSTNVVTSDLDDFIYPGQAIWISIWTSDAITVYSHNISGSGQFINPSGCISSVGLSCFVRTSLEEDAAPISFPAGLNASSVGSIPTILLEPE